MKTTNGHRSWRLLEMARQGLMILAVLGILCLTGANLWHHARTLKRELDGGIAQQAQGHPFRMADAEDSPWITDCRDIIPPEARTFYWHLPNPLLEAATECQAIRLNYYLYPTWVGYRDDTILPECDYIVTESALEQILLKRLAELQPDSAPNVEFEVAHRGDSVLILKRRQP